MITKRNEFSDSPVWQKASRRVKIGSRGWCYKARLSLVEKGERIVFIMLSFTLAR